MSRRLGFSIVLFAAAAAAFLAGSWHAAHEAVSASALRVEPHRVLYYTDGMHPEIRAEAPGTCPICGMTLQPVYADAAASALPAVPEPGGAIAISPRQQQLIGVRVGTVEESAGADRIRLFGRVAPDENRLYRVNIGTDGYAREVSGVTTGNRVMEGEWLATISTPELRQPSQAFLVTLDVFDREARTATRSEAQLELARTGVDFAAERLLALGMARPQLDEIRRTRVAPTTMRIAAPADGYVLTRNISLGEKIEKGTELYRIADLRAMWILADVPAAEMNRIGSATVATVTVPGRAAPIRARLVTAALPPFDPLTQSARLRFEVDNPGVALRPDMFVNVDIDVTLPRGISVPADAVVATGLRNIVFVERSAGVFAPRAVDVGRRIGPGAGGAADRVVISKGLQPGERIALSGAFLLDSESRMKTHDRPDH
jgi:membrane fusion protein, copper/silver efflux system